MKKCYLFLIASVTFGLSFLIQKEVVAVVAYPFPIEFRQPDGTRITITLKGDERLSWAETADGYSLLSNGKKGWEYAVKNAGGDLVCSGILAHNQDKRKADEISFLQGVPRQNHFSKVQVDNANLTLKSATSINNFNPNGQKRLLMILIQFTDLAFSKTRSDFDGLMNGIGYNQNGAEGSVKDFFLEMSYGSFNLTTDIAPHVYTADHDMAYYGAHNGTSHDIRANDLMKEAVLKADADGVDFSQYDNDGDGSVDGVYIVYAGYGEATSGIDETIWPHAGGISGIVCDGKTIPKYSCSNELNYPDNSVTTIGVICHEFGHTCGAPDYYDTDYETGGSFDGTSTWDLMATGVYNKTISGGPGGSKPAHFNPFEKIRAGWVTPVVLFSTTNIVIPDITTNPVVYVYNTTTPNEYFMLENRQQTGFNAGCKGHGLMIYHYSKSYWDATRNKTAPQGFYPVCASAVTNPTTSSDATSYGTINSAGCPFPGSSIKKAFYDRGIPGSKSWAGANTGMPITSITENADHTVSFTLSKVTACTPTFNTQASLFTATTPGIFTTMDVGWIRGGGDRVLVVAREGNAVDFDPLNGSSYYANANFKSGDELGSGNYVVYNGTGTTASLTGLNGGTTYFFAVYEYNAGSSCYLTPALTGSGTTNCLFDPATYTEGFERNSFGCWTATDNTGQGNWKIGTTSNVNYTPALTGNYAYFSSEYGVAHNYNADLISPTYDLTSYSNTVLNFTQLFDASSNFPSTGTVSFSIDNGATWTQLASYTSDSPANPQPVSINIGGASGKSTVKFKWNYTCSPTGAYMWAVDNIQVKDNSNYWTGTTDNDWFKTGNWSSGAIPTASTSAVIPPVTNQPQINAAGAVCMNLTIQSGASLTMNASTVYTLSVTGDWINNGTFNTGIGTVDFNGTNSLQTIKGSSSTAFNILKVTKGAQDRILEATSLISLNAATNPLVLASGTFKLSSASTITPFTSDPSIGSTAGLWNNGGIINSGNYNWTLNGGLLKVSAGTINVGTSVNNYILYLNNGKITIEGGSINIAGRIRPNSGTSTCTYNQSGGVLTLNTVGSTSTSEPLFQINSSGSFTMSGGTIAIQKASSAACDYQNLASTSNVTGGTIQIGNASTTGSPVIRINSIPSVYDLTVNSTGTPTAKLLADLTVKNNTTIGSGAKIDLNSLTLTVKGNWTNNGGSLTTTPTGTVTFNGTGAQSVAGTSATTFNNLTVNNSNGITLSGSVNAAVNGVLTLSSGVISTNNNKISVSSTGSVSRTSGHIFGNLQKNVATGTNVSRTFETGDAGEANYTPVSVTFAAVSTAGDVTARTTSGDHTNIATSRLIPAKSINRYWTLSNSSTVFTTYDAVLNFLSGDADPSANTSHLNCGLYASSNWAYPAVGTRNALNTSITGMTSFGDFQLAEGIKYSIAAGGNWSNPATWSPSGVPVALDDILIVSPGLVTLDTDNAECRDLTVQSGASFQINPSRSLTITGNLSNSGTFTIESGSLTSSGSLIVNGSSSGNVIYNRQFTVGDYDRHLVSSPVTGTLPTQSVEGSPKAVEFYAYQVSDNSWPKVTGTSVSGKGYSMEQFSGSSGKYTFSGSLVSSDFTVTPAFNTNGAGGWNLLGNPFTSAMNIKDGPNGFLTVNQGKFHSSYEAVYVYVDGTYYYISAGGTPGWEQGGSLGQDYIQAGQGFFVCTTAAQAPLSFNKAMQSHVTAAPLKDALTPWPGLELKVASGDEVKSTLVVFNNGMKTDLDPGYDVGLLKSGSGVEIYTTLLKEGKDIPFARQALPLFDYDKTIVAVGLDSEKGGRVTFSAKSVPSGNSSFYLEDRKTGIVTDLGKENYSVTLPAGTYGTGRFFIHTSINNNSTAVGELERLNLKVWISDHKVMINGPLSLIARASVFDLTGRKIGDYRLTDPYNNSFDLPPATLGMYLIRVEDGKSTATFKVIN